MTCYTFGTERIYSHREQQWRLKNEQDDRKSKTNPSTPEDLECRWSKTMRFGDKVIVAGYYYNGPGKPSYFGAVYEYLTADTACDAEIGLWEVSGLEFIDEGHAIEWTIKNAK